MRHFSYLCRMDTAPQLAGLRAVYLTLGCKLNFAETSTMAERLREAGISVAKRGEKADLCLINTCSVTEVADAKSRQAIRRLVREHPEAAVVVTGCYAQLRPSEVGEIEGVDLVVGAEAKARLPQLITALLTSRADSSCPPPPKRQEGKTAEIRTFVPSCACGNRTRYFLKVQDGCDSFCTYCTVPYARGRSRCASVASLVAQAREAASRGGKEIVLTGVNIGDYGKTTGESLLQLMRELDQVEGIERYRLSSIEPDLLGDDILDFIASSRAFMPHFHLPLQSGSDEVLRLMHRHYTASAFASTVESIRRRLPQAFIGVDVIVGTRGESDALFQESLRMMASLDVSQYHVFSYSERPGTAALRLPHPVDPREKHRRSRQALALSKAKLKDFYERNLGTTRPVLLEHSVKGGLRRGFTDNYIRVEVATETADNEVVDVRLDGWNQEGTLLKGTKI